MKKNVYFVQANPVYGEDEKSVYIPYAAGCIAAYAWADNIIQSHYNLGRLIYTRENVDESVASLENPYLVGFSCSVWNMEYNKAYSKRLKEVYPQCIVLFGGHHVSRDASNLNEFQFVNILVHGAGEEAFKDILLHLIKNKPLHSIANISFRGEDGCAVSTGKNITIKTDYPSPYLEGYFDDILKDNIKFSAIIETNRGCPNNCAFCDWGDLKANVRLFPLKKIKRELIWMMENRIEYLYCGDANFGLFDRDEEITDLIIKLKREKGYPQKFRVSFTKNRSRFVEKISKKLNDNNIDKFHTLSFQSLSPVVLENIGRKNLDLKHFKELMVMYNHSGIFAVSELILGLPGETYDSFCNGICTLLECGQHNSITVYPCELLPNSQLGAAEYIVQYGIKSIRTPYYQIHCEIAESSNEIQEYSEFIIGTNTLTQEEWVRSVLFSCYIQALHNLGLLRAIAIYLRFENNISYLSFYTAIIEFFKTAAGTMVHKVYHDVKALAQGVSAGNNAWVWESEKFGHITWGFEEIIFLELASNLSIFFMEIKPFLEKYMHNGDLSHNLLYYQQSIIKQPQPQEGDIAIHLEYDFYNYFEKIYKGECSSLTKVKNTVKVLDDKPVENWDDYSKEIVWFGRTVEATLYTGSKYIVSVAYEDATETGK